MKSVLLLFLFFTFFTTDVLSQREGWYIGMSTGPRVNFMKITEMSPDIKSVKRSRCSGVVSAFAYRGFNHGNNAVRVQISYLGRGAKYTGIKAMKRRNLEYSFKAGYLDMRIPFIFEFNRKVYYNECLFPYFYVSPVFGMVTGGRIELSGDKKNAAVKIPVAKSNVAEFFFGAGFGLGTRYRFRIDGEDCFTGFEMMYDLGFLDTYGKSEKDGESVDVGKLVKESGYPLKGRRSFSGLEFQVSMSVPLNLFKHGYWSKRQKFHSIRNL